MNKNKNPNNSGNSKKTHVKGKNGNQLPKLPKLPKLPINILKKEEIVLLIIYDDYKTQTQILECIKDKGINLSKVSMSYIFSRKRGDNYTGHLHDGLVEETFVKGVKHYKATEEGRKVIDDLINIQEQKREQKEKKFKEYEDKVKFVDNITKKINYFIECTGYKQEILNAVNKKLNSVEVDFQELINFDPILASDILENEDVDEILMISNQSITINGVNIPPNFKLRYFNLPSSEKMKVRDLRAICINRLISFDSLIISVSTVKPRSITSNFECPSCGERLSTVSKDGIEFEPKTCNCGRKGKLRKLQSTFSDIQWIRGEETAEDIDHSSQPTTINILVSGDLCDKEINKTYVHGEIASIVGILRTSPKYNKMGKSSDYDIYIEAISIKTKLQQEDDNLTAEDIEQIKEISQNEPLKQLKNSLCPKVCGHDNIKTGLVLQLFCGYEKVDEDRKRINILVMGDPGVAKSEIKRGVLRVAPKIRSTSGTGASGVGLTASVQKDEITGMWFLKAGPVVLAHKGIVCIDEIDKMNKEEVKTCSDSMEEGEVNITKAGIYAKLNAKASHLVIGNPKNYRFNTTDTTASQLGLPSYYLDRFDLIFAVKDLPNEHQDKDIANLILKRRKDNEILNTEINDVLFKKYIKYAKRFNPIIDEEAEEKIKNFYAKYRKKSTITEGIQKICIGPRQLSALCRLSEAHARLRLSEKVNIKDFLVAKNLMFDCFKILGVIDGTGELDVDTVVSGASASDRLTKMHLGDSINKYFKEHNTTEGVSISRLKRYLNSPEGYDEYIKKLKFDGDVFIINGDKIKPL